MGMLLMLLVALSATAQQGTETVEPLTVTVGANHAPPYRILENGQRTGLYVDIFEEISARLGWKVHYREAPFRRVLRMMRLGEVDLMLGPLQTNERKKMMEFVVPAFPPERRLFSMLTRLIVLSVTLTFTENVSECWRAPATFPGLMETSNSQRSPHRGIRT